MLEDGLQDVKNLLSDMEKDITGEKYLKMANSVSFSEMFSYVIRLPVSEHWRPEVKLAKKNVSTTIWDLRNRNVVLK